jgi:hypothetical protein
MFRFVFAFLAALSFSPAVFAQAAPGAASSQSASPAAPDGEPVPSSDSARPFPLVPILETILAGEIFWRPDWPVETPPDLFAVYGEARSVTVTLEFPAATVTGQADMAEAGSSDTVNAVDVADLPEPVDKFEYALIRDGDGRLTVFPFFMDGGFFQTAVTYDEQGRIADLTVLSPVLWRIEFMKYDDETGLPVLARLNAGSGAHAVDNTGSGGVWFFATLEYGGMSVSETWYDPAGTGLSVYNYRYDSLGGKKRLVEFVDFPTGERDSAEYHYDSWGNLTGIGGVYSAVYRENRPQYWRRPFPLPPAADDAAISGDAAAGGASSGEMPWRFIVQWDERRLVTRLLGYPEDENAGGEWDARYTYALDDGDNWTERREIRMIRQGDYLFPQTGLFVSRKIGYRER